MTEPLAAEALAEAPAPDPESVGSYVVHFGDVRTGGLWGTLPASDLSWTSELRETGDTSASIPPSPQAAQLWEALQVGPALVAVEWRANFARRILWASPVVFRALGRDGGMQVEGDGMFGLLDARLLIPDVPAPSIPTAPGMTFTGDMGTIMRAMVAQVLSLDVGDLPIVLEAPRAGTRTQTYHGYEMASAAQRIKELAGHRNGPDFVFLPRFADGPDYTRIVWDMVTGTEEQPLLDSTADRPIILDGAAPGQNTIRGLSWSETVGATGTHAFAVGAGSQAATKIAAAVDTTLTGRGWPRLDVTSSNDSDNQATVQAEADGLLARQGRASRAVTVEVDAAFWWSQNARLGDSVRVMFGHPIAGRIDLTSRLVAESGSIAADSVTLKLGDVLAEEED